MIKILARDPDTLNGGGELFMGNLKAAQDLEAIQENEVTHIVQVAKELEPYFVDNKEIKYKSIRVGNEIHDTIEKHFKPFCKFVKQAISCGDSVLVHDMTCTQRAPAFVAAYLITEK